MADEEIGVKLIAKNAGLTEGMAQATAGIKQAVGQIEGHFAGLGQAMKNLQTPFMALGAALAGGAIFKDMVKETLKWTGEAVVLSRQLGITSEKASILNMALGDLRIESETYLKAAQMMTRQIASGGEGFEKLGVKIKDAKGNLKPTTDLMAEVMTKLNGIKAGTDRNVAGMAIFGRSWGEASKILRLSSEALEEARIKAEKLGLLVGSDSVEAAKKYKMAMNEVEDVVTALKVRIGKELLPVLTAFGDELEKTGPSSVSVLSGFIKGLTYAWLALKFAVETVAIVITSTVMAIVAASVAAWKMLQAAAALDWEGVKNAAKEGMTGVKNEIAAGIDEINERAANGGDKLKEIWNPTAKKSKADGPEKKGFDPDKGKDGSDKLLQAMKAELEDRKALEENWFTWSVSRELAFWQEKLGKLDKGTKGYISVLSEVNKLRKQKQQEAHEAEIEGLKAQMDTLQGDGEARLAVQQEITKREIKIHGNGSKEVIAALREESKVRREIADENTRILEIIAQRELAHGEAMVDLESQTNAQRYALGEISEAQQIQQEANLAEKKYQIQRAALAEEMLMAEEKAELQAQIFAKQVALSDIHTKNMQAISNQAALQERTQMEQTLGPMTQAWDQAIAGMINGTIRLNVSFRSLWDGLGKMMSNVIKQMLTEWIASETKKLMVNTGLKIKELWLHLTTEKAKATATVTSAKTSVVASAIEGGAKGATSAASIPVYGWVIAIAAGLAIMAGIKSMLGGMPSAAGGWDQIPNDQLAQLHKNEMVLPAHLAEKVRNMSEDGGGGGGTFAPVIHINTMDSKSFGEFLNDKSSMLNRWIKEQNRNFVYRT